MTSRSCAISVTGLSKIYEVSGGLIEVLRKVDLEVPLGDFISIRGYSGAGKTTLLNLIGGIDRPTQGKIVVFGEDIVEKDENQLADYRCDTVGFVFQSYNLISTLTVAENIAFPMEWKQIPADKITDRVDELLQKVGMEHRFNHFPSQLSGGEQQRVAFARALANDPPLLLADEPTGNLDDNTGRKITEIICLLKEQGKTIIASTHDARLIGNADQLLTLENGRLTV